LIPKIINYVWLSDDTKPDMIMKCLNTWNKLPDYKIQEWKSGDFKFEEFPIFVREAYNEKKWAFVTDYLRLWILYNYGGIYLDSDIFLKKDISEFLDNSFFSFIEYHENGFKPYDNLIDENGNPLTDGHIPGFCIQAAFMGAEKGNNFIKSCMEYYELLHFINEDGSYYDKLIAPDIYALCAREFGFKYKNELQKLDDRMTIYPSVYCAGTLSEINKKNYAIHCCAGSWREYSELKRKIKSISNRIKILLYLR
jgi:hypothetical protein